MFRMLTHCILVDFSTVICWTSSFIILGVSAVFCCFYFIFDGKLSLAISVEPYQMPHYEVLILVCTVCL